MDDEQNAAPIAARKPSYRSLYHQLLAKLLEIVLTPVDITVESEIRVMSDPPRADILLLRRGGKQWSDVQRRLLPDGVRDRNARHHLLECKFWDEPHNEFLRLFASRQTVRKQTIDDVLRQPLSSWPDPFWAVLLGLQRIYQLEDPAVKGEMTVEDVMEIGAELRRQAIASASVADLSEPLRKQAIANASVDDLSEPLRKQTIASASPEDRLAGLAPEDRLAGLSPEQMADMLKQIEALLAMQATTPVRHRGRTRKR